MEQLVILILMVLLVGVRAATGLSISRLEANINRLEAEESQIQAKTAAVEEAKLQLERDHDRVGRDITRLETDRELVEMDIRKFGATPVPESELDAMQAAGHGTPTTKKTAKKDADEATPDDTPEEGDAGSETEDSSPESQPAGGRPSPHDRDGSYRILVVDDNTQLRDILKEALGRQGIDVISARDGVEALTVLYKKQEAVDLVITDLNMPNVDGVSLIRNLPEGSRYIVISAYLESDHFREAVSGIEPLAILKKPFKLSELRAAVDRARQEGPSGVGRSQASVDLGAEPVVDSPGPDAEASNDLPPRDAAAG